MSNNSVTVTNDLPFTQTPNETARDKRLSLEARGALTYLLSHSQSYKFRINHLLKEFGIGRDKLLRITNELKKFGYLNIITIKTSEGKFAGSDWLVFGQSQNIDFRENRDTENTDIGKNRDTENTDIGKNRTTENTDTIKKNNLKEEKEEKKEEQQQQEEAFAFPETSAQITAVTVEPKNEIAFGDQPQPHERLRFFPKLEKLPMPIERLNEICDLFVYITNQQKRKTLQQEDTWVEMVKKLELEGMTVHGIECLYRYGIEVKKMEFVTPKQIDWLFPEYKDFVKNGGKAKTQYTSY